MNEAWGLPHNTRQAELQRAFEGRLAIGPMLDRGAVAEVYLVQRTSSSPVQPIQSPPLMALKVLRPFLGLDPEIAAMFVDEIELMQILSHSGVVRCIEGEHRHKPPYLLLEFVPGCNLAHFFQSACAGEERLLSWEVVWEIAVAMAESLAYLHTATGPNGTLLQLIHRDLSPPNVLLGLQGEVRLADFGISIFHNMARATSGEDPKGKFSYLAPEMLQGIPVDQRADIFSWGIIVWELLTGHRLFEAKAPEETLKLLGDAPILAPHQLRPGVPPALEQIVMQALTRDRDTRYDNVSQLLRELHTHQPIPQANPTPTKRTALADCMQALAQRGLLPPHTEPFWQQIVSTTDFSSPL